MTIFIDTNVLLALVRTVDPLHDVARSDLDRLRKHDLQLPAPVLVEACHFMRRVDQRARLADFIRTFDMQAVSVPDDNDFRLMVFDWMMRYAEHTPDYADACLCVLSAKQEKSKIWTYDSEFRYIWRRPDGSAVPLAVK